MRISLATATLAHATNKGIISLQISTEGVESNDNKVLKSRRRIEIYSDGDLKSKHIKTTLKCVDRSRAILTLQALQ